MDRINRAIAMIITVGVLGYFNASAADHESFLRDQDLMIQEWMLEPIPVTDFKSSVSLEAWMLEPFQASTEPAMVLETWMLESFQSNSEPALALEEWMMDSFNDTNEPGLSLEAWMLESFQELPDDTLLALEDWMLNFSKFS